MSDVTNSAGNSGTWMRCTAVTQESNDVRTFHLRAAEDGSFPEYLAGQFATLELDIDGQHVRRCYTISSTPVDEGSPEITFTVKAKSGGQVSPWLHDNLVPGQTVRVLPPAGRFCINSIEPRKYVFVAGGVGITPLLSMARWLVRKNAPIDLIFIQCARYAHDLLFVDELRRMTDDYQGFRLVLQPSSSENWEGTSGRLTQSRLLELVPDLSERHVYCCGPEGFMQHVQSLALQSGVPATSYFEESFELGALGSSDSPLEQVQVRFARSGCTVDSNGSQTLLEAARSAGINVPYSCEAGICGSCKVKVLSGEVDHQHQGGIEDYEIAEGWILSCCSRPLTTVDLDA